MVAKANADTSAAAYNTNYIAPLVAKFFNLEYTRLRLPIVLLKKIIYKKPRPRVVWQKDKNKAPAQAGPIVESIMDSRNTRIKAL